MNSISSLFAVITYDFGFFFTQTRKSKAQVPVVRMEERISNRLHCRSKEITTMLQLKRFV